MIDRMAESYCLLLETLEAGTLLRDANVVSAADRQKLLFAFNNTAADYPKGKCVHTLFEEQAARTPDKTAVIACDRTLTYRELNEEANRIAHGLIKQGVSVGEIVAFALPRKSYLISAMLGILKTGSAYLPIDPEYPQDRIDYLLSDSNAALFICENTISDVLKSEDRRNPDRNISSNNLCYCIYTSGSTGKPKGVVVSHRNVINFISTSFSKFQRELITTCDCVLATNSVVFDITIQDLLLPLLHGLSVVFADEKAVLKIDNVLPFLPQKKLGLIVTPTKLRLYLQSAAFKEILKRFAVIMVGAEPFPTGLVEELRIYTSAVVFNGYGPTETTCGVLYARIENSRDICIGKPIANTQVHIVDRSMQLTPIGVSGELCIAGDGVGSGYLNRPELTAERFIENPFGKGKLYKTGDLAYWRDDGNIVFVGRTDYQVKIRGLRIELGEIENAMCALAGIKQAIVVVQTDDQERQYLVGYYVSDKAVDDHAMRRLLGNSLPKHMIPHFFCRLEMMPMTSSGKVDRKALPHVEIKTSSNYVAPKTSLQQTLCSAFADILGLGQVGIADDFFDLGGDSLKAIELLCKMQEMGIPFELQNLYEYPTVKSLTAHLAEAETQKAALSFEQFKKYDLLLQNKAKGIALPAKQPLDAVFLTGATGFLGAHILDALLKTGCPRVYCLVREKGARLYDLLRYYFGDTYLDDDRIIPVVGDLASVDALQLPEPVSLVIHAAATVKHYGNYSNHYQTNVVGTKNITVFAVRNHAKMIHISTVSVSGAEIAGNVAARRETEKSFSETDLYIGQSLDNVYIRSKFFAECAVLDAALEGLPAKIIRVGNLTNRRSDGMFQPNYESNAFLNRIKAILELGAFPDYLMDLYAEFSPIDDTADAIVRIASHWPKKQTIFHVYNNRHLYFRDMLPMLQTLGHRVQIVSDEEFSKRLMSAADPIIRHALVNDLDKSGKWVLDSNIHVRCDTSVNLLERLGFSWQNIDLAYLKQFLDYFRRIGYFQ